jgi:hypothetical protein
VGIGARGFIDGYRAYRNLKFAMTASAHANSQRSNR